MANMFILAKGLGMGAGIETIPNFLRYRLRVDTEHTFRVRTDIDHSMRVRVNTEPVHRVRVRARNG